MKSEGLAQQFMALLRFALGVTSDFMFQPTAWRKNENENQNQNRNENEDEKRAFVCLLGAVDKKTD